MARFMISRGKVIEHYNIAKDMSDMVSFSSKTNPDVARILHENTDSLFSIHMRNEFKHIKDLSRVLFLAQGWDEEAIDDMLKKGIKRFVVDNKKDLLTLQNFMENHDRKEKIDLLLRTKLKENSIHTERYYVFGMDSETVNESVGILKSREWIKNLGIHFHRKTQNMAEWNLQYELEQMFPEETFKEISIMNIGGGLPSIYANTNEKVFSGIMKRLKETKDWLNSKRVKMMIEPGRFIAAPSAKLMTKIISIHDNTIIVDASVYNSDMDAILVPVKLLVQGEKDKSDKTAKPYSLKGITPCSMDLFRYRVYLTNPKEGDELIFLNAGAYNFASDFCDLKKLESEIID